MFAFKAPDLQLISDPVFPHFKYSLRNKSNLFNSQVGIKIMENNWKMISGYMDVELHHRHGL